jgi:hypothetical protein
MTPTLTGTPTNTCTATLTSTPTPLPTPQGLIGILNNVTNYALLLWVKDANPNIDSYKVYMSTDGITYNLYGTFLKSIFTTSFCAINDNLAGTTFNRYYYVVSSNSGGTPPDSAQSRIVHAVSQTTASDDLSLSVTSGGSPVFLNITGGMVTGGVKRVWFVEDLSYNFFWLWGEEATGFNAVNYGFTNATGITYQPAATLSHGVTYSFDTVTLNNENWDIDISMQGFLIP